VSIELQHDLDAIKRSQALTYGIDQLRRARSAIAAASHDEPRELRRAVLQSSADRLASMLRELTALT